MGAEWREQIGMNPGYVAGWTRGERKIRDHTWAYEKAIRPGHWSVLEFSWFCYAITGVSRIATHELVRHRALSYMMESSRAGKFDGHIVPPSECFEEARRYNLLGSPATSILVAGNGRAWAEMLRKRLCLRAAPEIRWLAYLVMMDLKTVAPLVYACAVPDCNKCEEEGCA